MVAARGESVRSLKPGNAKKSGLRCILFFFLSIITGRKEEVYEIDTITKRIDRVADFFSDVHRCWDLLHKSYA